MTISRMFVLGTVVLLSATASTSALTPIADKNVPINRSANLVREAPDRYQPQSLTSAPEDVDFWMNVIPYEEDRYSSDQYIVIPTLGLVAPIQYGNARDQQRLKAGQQIDIDPYLRNGVMYYHGTAPIATEGNAVYFGHSNFFKRDPGRYKTVFGNVMMLDEGIDEVWYFVQSGDSREYNLHKYVVDKSYETVPTDVGIIKPQQGKETTLIACTDGRNGRWIIRGQYKPAHYDRVPNDLFDKTRDLTAEIKNSTTKETKEQLLTTFLTEWSDYAESERLSHPNVISPDQITTALITELFVKNMTHQI